MNDPKSGSHPLIKIGFSSVLRQLVATGREKRAEKRSSRAGLSVASCRPEARRARRWSINAPKERRSVQLRVEVAQGDAGADAGQQETLGDITGVAAAEDVVLGLAVQQFDYARVAQSLLVVLLVEGVASQVQHRCRDGRAAVVLGVLAHQLRPLRVHLDRLVMRL